jgi:hypothetical protein
VSRPCTICSHPEAFAINEALVLEKKSNRSTAKQYGVDHNAIQRHKQHIPELLLKASRALEVADADALLAGVENLYAEALAVLETGKDSADLRLVLAAIDRAGKQLETLAELRGELNRQPTVNIVLTAEWARIRAAMMDALGPYVEARVAVSRKLLELEGGNGSGSS